MSRIKSFYVHSWAISFFPYNISQESISTKYFIAQQLQLCLLIIINRDKNYPPEESKDFAI